MNWSFAIVNNRLAEIYFERRGQKLQIIGHCYVQKEEYKTKREQRLIAKDTLSYRFSYRNKKYTKISPLPQIPFETTRSINKNRV